MIYSDIQNQAIDAIVEWYGDHDKLEFYLAGFAGTGKSTVCAEAIRRIKEKYKIDHVVTGAYTGKAVHVMRKKGVHNAQTIHSLIYTPSTDKEKGEVKFELNELSEAAQADLIVLDEVSFVDEAMARDLRTYKKKILVMGDEGQLPPINGQGGFANLAPDFALTEIHRQALDSPILELANMARQGIPLPMYYQKGDVRVLPLINANLDYLYDREAQVLCGVHRVRWSVTQLIRQERGFTSRYPEVGESIICCKNNKNKGLFNGATGTLSEFGLLGDSYRISGNIEGREYKKLLTDPYLFKQHFDNGESKANFRRRDLNFFDWSYCQNVHKFQGSSHESIVLIDNSNSFRENAAKWLYTGLTRSEKRLTVLV